MNNNNNYYTTFLITGSQGAIFQGSLQTPLIYSRDELR